MNILNNLTTKNKILLAVAGILICVLIITVSIHSENNKRASIVQELSHMATQHGLNDVEVTILEKSKEYDWYNVGIYASNLDKLSYSKLYKIDSFIYCDDASVKYYQSPNNTYYVYSTSIYKNNDLVWSKNSEHTCEECSSDATHSYVSPFSGQTEWYCTTHYRELQDLLNGLGAG